MAYTVATVIGSLRKDSFTRKLTEAMEPLAPKDMKFVDVKIGDLPLFNQDNEGHPTAAVTAFKTAIEKADAVLFATPEYNRSVPGALKNALDVGSRPYGKSAWNGKPAAILSVSPGGFGGFGANHHLRQTLAFLNMHVLAQPEAYISNAAALLDDKGGLAKQDTKEFFGQFLQNFDALIKRYVK